MKQYMTFIILGVLALFAILASTSLFVVNEREQALVLFLGKPRDPEPVIREPGLKFKVPFAERVVIFSDQILGYDSQPREIPTLGQKQLLVDAFTRCKIVDPLKFFQTVITVQGVEARLESIIGSNLRETLGKVTLTRVLTDERSSLMDEIAKAVNEEASSFGVEVVDVRIKRVDLPPTNSQAIFRRMQTQREQEARKFRAEGAKDAQFIRADAEKTVRVMLAEANRERQVLRGEGEAQAEAIYREAYGTDPEFFEFYRTLQAIEKATSSDTTSYVGSPNTDLLKMFETDNTQFQKLFAR